MAKHRSLRSGFGELLAWVCVGMLAYAVLHVMHPGAEKPHLPARKPVAVALPKPRVVAKPVVPQPALPRPLPRQKIQELPEQPPAQTVSRVTVAAKPRIALVIDDWGYSTKNLHLARALKFPLTAAVIPRLAYSSKVSEDLHSLGFEIIVHVPMEPHEHKNLEKSTIMTSWNSRKIETALDQAFASVRHARGMNNHMGSKATADPQTMENVIGYLRGKGLYYLDSYVSSESLGFATARNAGVPAARRDIFLDNSDQPAAIREQLQKLKDKAVKEGTAIGIGHDRPATLRVLLEEVPKMQAQGIEFVYASQLTE